MTQTPKQKAAELFTHYHNLIQNIGGELGQEILVSILAKECALFAANQVLNQNYKIASHHDYIYWEEVIHELIHYEE